MTEIVIVAAGPRSTVQDLGRAGYAAMGVGHSGAADQNAARLANRLVGNTESAGVVETTLGGLGFRLTAAATIAVTGADCPLQVGERREPANTVLRVPADTVVQLGVPRSGLRNYVAVRGGIDAEEVLGSRSTDVLSGLGPSPLEDGVRWPIGDAARSLPNVELAPVSLPSADELVLPVLPGPRAEWFVESALATLFSASYEVSADSDRIGMRLSGPTLDRRDDRELPSEGVVLGALQVPPSGQPTLFLADHPVTGGYPVIGVVLSAGVARAAQARPGQRIRFRRAG